MKSELIQYAPLFAGLSEEDRTVLESSFVEGQSAAKSALLEAGDRAEAIYLVGQGFVNLSTSGGQNLATLGPGSILGEASLLGARPMDVTATALADLLYWKLSDDVLRKLIVEHPSIGMQLSQNFGKLVVQMEDYLARQLAATDELSRLPSRTLQTIASELQPVEFQDGDIVFVAGDSPDGLYLLESGSVGLRPETSSGMEKPATMGPGALLGSASLLTDKPSLTTATANGETTAWLLEADRFNSISVQHPGLRRALAQNVTTPLSSYDQTQAVQWLAQMPMFREVSPDALRAVAATMQLKHVPAGERVYMMGDSGDALYLIERGEIEQTAPNASGAVEEIGRVTDGGFFGEMALLTGQIRSDNTSAVRHTNLWILQREDLDTLANNHSEIGKALSQGVATKLASENGTSDSEHFRMFALLADLSPEELEKVASYLEPMRYRAGEQLYRSTGPADRLFLLESGQVRIQPLGGGSWLLGPGEEFGERALLTNQPHNATAFAETDTDVWTLSKSDFDMLMGLYPGLAISMSRILTERLSKMEMGQADNYTVPLAEDAFEQSGSAGVPTNLPSRRMQDLSYEPSAAPSSQTPVDSNVVPVASPSERTNPVQWFTNLSTFGKLRLAFLVLLVIWIVGIAAPWAIMSLLRGSASVASGADIASSNLFNAVNKVYAVGSYELRSKDADLAQVLAMADQQVPPTATATAPPTATPIPTNTPLPTPTPLPTSTPLPTETNVPYVPVVAPEPVIEEPEVQAAAAAAPPRIWDGRLTQLGARVDDAQVAPGQEYWRVTEARWEDEVEAAGRHHIYVEVLDENGQRIVNQPVTVFWSDGNFTSPTEDKNPPDYAFNYQMYAAGNAYDVKVEGLPSDVFRGAGMGDLERPRYGIHTAFYITFQKARK